MNVDEDLGGLWSGEFRYSGQDVSVPFTLAMVEQGGLIRGVTLEPATFGTNQDEEYEATIRGDRVGPHLWFSKIYASVTGIDQPPLLYSGSVDAAFTRITGRWVLPGDTPAHGTFSLSRVATRCAAMTIRTTTRVG
jgi:hypothetical protein